LLEPTIIGNVLSKGELTIDMIILAVSSFDCEVAVLIDKTLSPFIETFGRGVGPPLVLKKRKARGDC
jgi:hypothetical protein